jgi:hypothetical protein
LPLKSDLLNITRVHPFQLLMHFIGRKANVKYNAIAGARFVANGPVDPFSNLKSTSQFRGLALRPEWSWTTRGVEPSMLGPPAGSSRVVLDRWRGQSRVVLDHPRGRAEWSWTIRGVELSGPRPLAGSSRMVLDHPRGLAEWSWTTRGVEPSGPVPATKENIPKPQKKNLSSFAYLGKPGGR